MQCLRNLAFPWIVNGLFSIMAVSLYSTNVNEGEQPTVLIEDSKALSHYVPMKNPVLHVKDLGPQVDWMSVFLLEYSGPLVIHQVIIMMHGMQSLSSLQLMAWLMVSFHYMKRLYESLFVHRFSNASMPVSSCVKNCAHYWLVGGFALAGVIYNDNFAKKECSAYTPFLIGLFFFSELGNMYAHYKLRFLRPQGTKKRAIPTGFPFTLVSCPNYTFEVMSWLSFAMMVNHPVAWFFAITGAVQMWLWAVKKHKNYIKEFPDYPKNRTAMIPFIC